MTPKDAETQAEEYINKVLDSQKTLGYESKVSESEYRRAVKGAAHALSGFSRSESIAGEDSGAAA